MSEHPRPPALPTKRSREELTLRGVPAQPKRRKGGSLFTSAVSIFVTASAVAYVLVAVSGVNTPLYLPTMRRFSLEPVQDVIAMGFYGRMLYAGIAGLALTIVHILLRPIFAQFKLIKQGYLTVMASVSVWFAVAFILVEEWHDWGIVRRKLDTTQLVNDEFYLGLIGLIVFFGGVLLTAFAVKRVAALSDTSKLQPQMQGRQPVRNGVPAKQSTNNDRM